MDACKETLTVLLDEREGRALPERSHQLAEHAKDCPACSLAIAEWTTAIPKLQQLTTAPLPDTTIRRMENEILATMARPSAPAKTRRYWIPVAAAATLALAAGLILVPRLKPQVRFATLNSQWGHVTRAGQPLHKGDTLQPGDVLTVPADAEASLTLGRAVDSRVVGPARVSLEGDSVHPRLRLDAGKVFVRVEKRRPDETLRVQTLHGHVEVRGTCFVVGYEGPRSFVRVDEGEVAAFTVASTDGFPVRAGETYWLAPPPSPAAAAVPEPSPAIAPMDPAAASPNVGTDCDGSIAAARKAMRADKPYKALAVVEAALSTRDARVPTRCQDELGYLRAEALRQAGSIPQAIAAYKSLDRPNATKAMRQNALYAAGQLEWQRGNGRHASRLFDRAFSAYPDGALAEESLAGLLEAQERSGGDVVGTARRYLDRFPSGRAAGHARRLVPTTLPRTP